MAASRSKDGVFRFSELPSGANVTLPKPATTYLAPQDQARLTATDIPQSIKLSSVNTRGSKAADIDIVIFDRNMKEIKRVVIRPKAPFIYNFQALESISLKTESLSGAGNRSQFVLIESDKPLELSR